MIMLLTELIAPQCYGLSLGLVMAQQSDLHQAAREIFFNALRSVDAREATLGALNLEGSVLRIREWDFKISAREVYIIAIGKASMAMAMGALEVLGDEITGGLIIGNTLLPMDSLDPVRWQVFRGGHPLPTQQSLDGAQAAIKLLKYANDSRALIIFLISGGGSAMIEWPCDERITLAELCEAHRELVSCGASIAEINSVRRAFSAVKGGKLAAHAPHADQITLIISDTSPGDEATVASGPTLHPPAASPEPRDVVERYQLGSSFPASILRAIYEAKSDQPFGNTNSRHYVLLDNQTAIDAAAAKARQLGFAVEVADDIDEQSIDEGSQLLVYRLRALWQQAGREPKPVCLISGGEFSCRVRGNGLGGRNLETVLRCAIEFDKRQQQGDIGSEHFIALSAGTDGIDGNSPAAGAIADETTIGRGLSRGLDAEALLRNSDSFTFFNTLGDAMVTGATGTNVRDLRILIASF